MGIDFDRLESDATANRHDQSPILEGLRKLSALDKDHAVVKNSRGFNKKDSELGNALAIKEELNYEEQKIAKKLLVKYKEQLGTELYLKIIAFKPVRGVNTLENNSKAIYKVRFSYQGFHYAEFNDKGNLKFLKYKDGEYDTVDFIDIADPDDPEKTLKIIPAPQISQAKNDRLFEEQGMEPIKFPPIPSEYNSEYELYSDIKAFVHKFVEVRIEDEILITLYIMKAVLFDAIKDSSFPFVHVIAPYGKGKSRLLSVMCELTPWGFYTIDIKAAPLKRVSQLYGPILYIDEKGHMDSETSAMINAKYNKNSIVLNADKDVQRGFSSVIGYSIYGPMVLASRTPFRDDAIESKSLQINQDFELTRTDIPRKIKGSLLDQYLKDSNKIRGKLLLFRVNWHDKINGFIQGNFLSKYEKVTEPRLYEILSFFEDLIEIIPSLKEEVADVLEAQIIRNVEVSRDTPNGLVASTLLSIFESKENQIDYTMHGKEFAGVYLASVYAEAGENYSKQIGKIISALGLKTDRPRITEVDREGIEHKKRVSVVRLPDERKMDELKSRYDPEYMRSKLGSISSSRQYKIDD